MAWGRDVAWPQVRNIVHDFVASGGNLIDTAPAYGAGVAEKMIGKLLAGGLPRHQLVIATKAGFVIRDGKRVIDTSRQAMLSDLEGSLRRLNTDHIDLWQVHAWGDNLCNVVERVAHTEQRLAMLVEGFVQQVVGGVPQAQLCVAVSRRNTHQ